MTYSDPVKRPVDHRRARVVVGEWLRQQDGSPTSQRGRVNAALAEKCFEENARRQNDEDGLWSRLSEAYDVVNGAWYALTTAKARGRLFSSPVDDATKAEIEKEKGLLWHRNDPWKSYELEQIPFR